MNVEFDARVAKRVLDIQPEKPGDMNSGNSLMIRYLLIKVDGAQRMQWQRKAPGRSAQRLVERAAEEASSPAQR